MFCISARRVFVLLGWLLLGGLARAHAQVPAFSPRLAVPPDSLRAADEAESLPTDSLGRRFDEARVRLSLERYTRRKTIVGKGLQAFFRLTKPQQEDHGLDAVLLNRQFDQHNFKIVRRVTITPYDAFGYSLNDSLRQPRTFLEKTGNALHIRTARSRIRQVLLFRPGQPLLPQALAESERLLRQTDEILDARVLVNEATATRDSVDITVYTTDVFSITAGYELRGGLSQAIATLGDQNFLGLGHRLDNRYQYGRDLPQTWGYEANYRVPFRNFVYAEGHYFNEFESHSGGVSVRRDFYSPSARWAGAFTADVNNLRVVLPRDAPPLPGQEPDFRVRSFTSQSLWVGRAFRLRSYDLGYENPGRLIVASPTRTTPRTPPPRPKRPPAAPTTAPARCCSVRWATRCVATIRTSTSLDLAVPKTCQLARCSASRRASKTTPWARAATSTPALRRLAILSAKATSTAASILAPSNAFRTAAGSKAC
jgi:hypothetical protein